MLKKFTLPMADHAIAAKVEEMAKKVRISKLEAAILVNRGITIDMVDETMNISLNDIVDPRLMKDATKAAKAINAAIDNGDPIVLYSDYDCDGWGAAVVGYNMLNTLGQKVNIYTNTRNMGYGICRAGIDEIMAKWPETKVILTADNGIVALF